MFTITEIATVMAAILTGGCAVIAYVQWRGTDSWRLHRERRLTGKWPSEVRRWSIRHNLTDALRWPDPQNRRGNRRMRKVEDLYRCPRASSCVPPALCEACEEKWDLDGKFMAATERLAATPHNGVRPSHVDSTARGRGD